MYLMKNIFFILICDSLCSEIFFVVVILVFVKLFGLFRFRQLFFYKLVQFCIYSIACTFNEKAANVSPFLPMALA